MTKKRAMDLSINAIIIAALGLIVLIIIAIIFRTQIFHYSEGYKKTADKAIESAEGGCIQLFSGVTRKCMTSDEANNAKEKWIKVDGKCKDENKFCYEVGEKSTEQKAEQIPKNE